MSGNVTTSRSAVAKIEPARSLRVNFGSGPMRPIWACVSSTKSSVRGSNA